jgi:hypothetical protein
LMKNFDSRLLELLEAVTLFVEIFPTRKSCKDLVFADVIATIKKRYLFQRKQSLYLLHKLRVLTTSTGYYTWICRVFYCNANAYGTTPIMFNKSFVI